MRNMRRSWKPDVSAPSEFMRLATALAVLLAFATVARAQQPSPRDKVRIGVLLSVTDVMLYMADKKGYFAQERIDAEFVTLKSGTEMVAPLTSGDIDVAAGGPTAGLYNAVTRGIEVRIVADKGAMTGSHGHMPMLIAKRHAEAGSIKSLSDLKGMKVALTGLGGPAEARLYLMLKSVGLGFDDAEPIYLSPPQMAVAFQNGAIDAALILEPSATQAMRSGTAVHFDYGQDFYPNQQTAVVLYGPSMLKSRDLAQRFMNAYVRACRAYNDALIDGRVAGKAGDEIIDIRIESTPIKDRGVLRAMTAHGVNPDGAVGLESLKRDFEVFRTLGKIQRDVRVEDIVDNSYATAAAERLGPYLRAK